MSDPQEQSKIDFKPEPEPDSTQVETGERTAGLVPKSSPRLKPGP
ncbi:MAG: hypothetical protein R3D26_03175 [Cyanobacteriota/Melainabacteria group bacterium]